MTLTHINLMILSEDQSKCFNHHLHQQ